MIMPKQMHLQRLLFALLMVPVFATSSFAFPLSFSEQNSEGGPSLSTQLSVTQIGRLAVPRGLINIDGNEVEVQAVPEGLFDPRPVLNGVLINAHASTGKIRGLTYFFSGSWLNYLSQPPLNEIIQTADGATIEGRVLSGDEKSLKVSKGDGTTVSINFTDITDVRSPRAFSFLILMSGGTIAQSAVTQAEAKEIRFNSNNGGQFVVASSRPLSRLLGDEQGITKSQIASFLVLDFVALAAPMIAAPLVLGRGNNSARALEAQVNKLNAGQ